MKRFPFLITLATLTLPAAACEVPVYIGTYTSWLGSKGIYRTTLDCETGKLGKPVLVAKVAQPSFLGFGNDQKTLLAVGEEAQGQLLSYRVKADGALELLSRKATKGGASCHLGVDGTGKFVAVANYSGGNVAAFPLNSKGELGEMSGTREHAGASVNVERQEGPHPHGIHFFPGTRNFLVPDLGTDRVEVYHLDNKGRILGGKADGFNLPPGSGPRHCAVSGNSVFVVNELTCTVSEVRKTSTGKWKVGKAVSTLPEGWKGENTCAEILVHPGGKFLYVTNRGHNSVARFERLKGGGLRLLGTTPSGGKVPRNAALSADGRQLIVANQKTGNLVPFAVDSETGDLKQTGKPIRVSKAVCVLFAATK